MWVIQLSTCILLITTAFAANRIPSSAFKTLSCPKLNFTIDIDNTDKVNLKDPSVFFKYFRDSLGVYQYPGTPSVNLFLNGTQILIKDDIDNNVYAHVNKAYDQLLSPQVIGIANFADVGDLSKGLKDCAFFVIDDRSDSFADAEPPTTLQPLALEAVEECLGEKLCSSLGAIYNDDLIRAETHPTEFGAVSIWSRSLQINYPKMIPPRVPPTNHVAIKRINFIETVDTIIKNAANLFYDEKEGDGIEIPNLRHYIFTASRGIFTGIRSLSRDPSVLVRASPRSNRLQTFSFTFGIPQGNVEYREHRTFRIVPFVGRLCADVRDIFFTATVQMDFTQKHCRSSLIDFGTKSPGKAISYTCGRFSMFTNPIMRWFVSAWDNKVLQVIEQKVEWAMAAVIHDKFDCETFRPEHKYH